MKLNDPFGRVSRRQQQTYAALCARLKQQGVDDIASVHAFVARVQTLAFGSVIGVIAVTLIVVAVLPTLGGLIGVLGGIAGTGLAWLGLRAVKNMYQGYQHLVHLDAVMLLTAISVATVFAILVGMYPVWRVSRLAPAGLLKTQ